MSGALCRFLCAIPLLLIIQSQVLAEKRLAFVAGIDRYDQLPAHLQLQKAVNDANAVARALRQVGFQVTVSENGSLLDLARGWQTFLNQVDKGDVAAVFFAGHGVEISGQNFLLPRDVPTVQPGEELLLKKSSLRFDDLLLELQNRGARLNLVILDACRDNPFAISGGRSVGGSRGLARVVPAEGTFIMYSAELGQSALDRLSDGDNNPNSIFTRALLPLMQQKDVSLLQMARQVRRKVRAVARQVNHEQFPAYYDEVLSDFYLAGRSNGTDPPPPAAGDAIPPAISNDAEAKLACQRAILEDTIAEYEAFLRNYPNSDCVARIQSLYGAKVEKIQWDRAREANTIAGYRQYLIAFESGIYASEARRRLKTLTEPPKDDTAGDFDPLKRIDGYDVYGGDYRQIKRVGMSRCIEICQDDRRCRAYTYNVQHQLCFLKEAVDTLMPVYEAVSGARQSELSLVRPSNIRVFQNTDVAGGDYRNLRGSFLRCYKTCEGDPSCRSFAYVSRQSRCWLKGASQPRRRQKGVVFGVKE